MSIHQRNKGRSWEQQVARDLREAMPGADIRRGWQSRKGSDDADVICPLYWVECKCGKQPSPRAALRQAQKASPGGKWILAVIKDDRKEPFCVLTTTDLLDIKHETEGRGGHWRGMFPEPGKGRLPNLRALQANWRPDHVLTSIYETPPLAVLRWADMLRIIGEHWRVAQQ